MFIINLIHKLKKEELRIMLYIRSLILLSSIFAVSQCFETWDGGPDLDISFDRASYRMKFVVTGLPKGTWLGVIYGESMWGNDVVVFQQTGSDAPNIKDMYAIGWVHPRLDDI